MICEIYIFTFKLLNEVFVLFPCQKTKIETSEVRSNVQGKKPNKFQGSGKNQPVVSSQTDSSHGGSFGRPSSNYNNRSQVIGPQKGIEQITGFSCCLYWFIRLLFLFGIRT